VPRVSLAGGPDQKLAQSQTATPCSNCRLTRASPISARADLSPSTQLVGPIMEATKYTKTGTLEKPTETLNTGFSIRTSTVAKGPHPKLGSTEVSAFQNFATYSWFPPKLDGLSKSGRTNVCYIETSKIFRILKHYFGTNWQSYYFIFKSPKILKKSRILSENTAKLIAGGNYPPGPNRSNFPHFHFFSFFQTN